MIGKANEIKVVQVSSEMRYDPTNQSGQRWVPVDIAINEKLAELDEVEVISIQYQVEQSETALIIYRFKN